MSEKISRCVAIGNDRPIASSITKSGATINPVMHDQAKCKS